MKVLFVLHDFLPEHVGGTEVHTFELARELARRGHEPVILCTERDLARADGEIRERRHAGLRVLEAAHAREYAAAEDLWEEPRQRELFARVLSAERPDVVHVQHFAQWGTGVLESARRAPAQPANPVNPVNPVHPAAPAAQAAPAAPAAALGPAVVVTLHDYHLLCASATLLRGDGALCAGDCAQCLEALPAPRAGRSATALQAAADARRARHRRDLEHAHAVIAPSRFLAELFVARGLVRAERVVRIDSGVAGPWREPRASDPALPLRVGYVGGLYPSKGVHVLIEAFRELERGVAVLDVHGVLEWFPSYVGHLRALAGGGEGPRPDVRFHGRFAPEDLDALLDALDVLVLPSLWYENRPLSLQAAFRRGLAVVASDLGGMAELLGHGRHGVLFPRGDAASLARALRDLAADRARVLALARARPALASIEETAERHLALYAAAITALSSGNP